MTGVALPLISREFEIGSAENGFIGAASLLGILVGAVGLGGISDRFGRKPMFIIEMRSRVTSQKKVDGSCEID